MNVSGGVVQEVFASDLAVKVILVDWDSDSGSGDDQSVVTIMGRHRRLQPAHVATLPIYALRMLEGTDVGAALKASVLLLPWAASIAQANKDSDS